MDRGEAELTRTRAAGPRRADRSGRGATPWPGRVTTTASGSLAVGKFVLMQPMAVTGAEVEGGAGTLTDVGPTVPVYWIGPKVPATGDKAIVVWTGHRWGARKKLNAPVAQFVDITLYGCNAGAASVYPATLTLTMGSTTVSATLTGAGTTAHIPVPASGTYAVSIVARGYNTASGSMTVAPGTATTAATYSMTLKPGWECNPSTCNVPYPDTLYLSNSSKGFTSTLHYYSPGSSSRTWSGSDGVSRSFTLDSYQHPGQWHLNYNEPGLPIVVVDVVAGGCALPLLVTFSDGSTLSE